MIEVGGTMEEAIVEDLGLEVQRYTNPCFTSKTKVLTNLPISAATEIENATGSVSVIEIPTEDETDPQPGATMTDGT